jgi:hypothetical protein
LSEAGFEKDKIEFHIPSSPLMKLELYVNLEGVFQSEFRNCDSNWSLVTEEELGEAQSQAKKIRDAGEGAVAAFFDKHEKRRKEIGQTTTVIVSKSHQ